MSQPPSNSPGGSSVTQIPTWSSGPVTPPTGRAVAGTVIGGRYSLRSAVGNGGMGTVWRAADTLLRRDVAVKEVVLPPGLAPSDRDAMYERTLREARAAAALQHPAVVQVYDVVTEGGRPWIVMELLEARSLAELVIEDGPLAPRAVAKIGIALLGALEMAHANGVLHRDVKPANVLICTDGRCVLTDFGVARMPTDVQLTTPGMVLGSPHFISPERAMGQNFGPPSDLFSLGVTLYTASEGRPPFDKGDPIETMHSIVEDPPAAPVRSGPLVPVLMGLLEKDPARRMDVTTARGLLRDLLAGPLANNATINNMTDPYAVVRVAQPPMPPVPPPPAQAATPKQIGGRAMLAPGESLTDRLAKLRAGERPAPAGPASSAPLDETSPNALGGLDTPTGAMSPPAAGHEQTQVIGGYPPAPAGQRPGQQYGSPAQAGPVYGTPGGQQYGTPAGQQYGSPAGQQYGGGPAGQQYGNPGGQQYGAPAQTYGAPEQQWGAPGQQWVTPPGAGQDRAGGLAGVVAAVKQLPPKTRYALAGGLAVLLLIIGVLVIPGGDDDAPMPQAGTESVRAAAAGRPDAGAPRQGRHRAGARGLGAQEQRRLLRRLLRPRRRRPQGPHHQRALRRQQRAPLGGDRRERPQEEQDLPGAVQAGDDDRRGGAGGTARGAVRVHLRFRREHAPRHLACGDLRRQGVLVLPHLHRRPLRGEPSDLRRDDEHLQAERGELNGSRPYDRDRSDALGGPQPPRARA